VLSPVLFNFFKSDCLTTADIYITCADDVNEYESDPDLTILSQKLQPSVDNVVEWSDRKQLKIAPGKSEAMLFSPWNKQYNSRSDVKIGSIDVPLNKYLKFLGVTFNPLFTFYYHILDIYKKVCQRLNLIRAVSGSSWGHHKDTLILIYRALLESVLSYACTVWFPNAKPTNIQKLQFAHNSTMHLITGCHKAADLDHLNAETEFMPVAAHLSMLYTQFLASCLHPSHPSHEIVGLPPGPRHNTHGRPLKETLSCFHDNVSP
jgi:hypothetical protein